MVRSGGEDTVECIWNVCMKTVNSGHAPDAKAVFVLLYGVKVILLIAQE